MSKSTASSVKSQAVLDLLEAGAELLKQEDRHGETRSGWWLDGCWLAPGNDPEAALRAIRG